MSFEHVDDFRRFMHSHGFAYNGPLTPDGRPQRVHLDGDKPGSKNGMVQFFADGMGGVFQNWREHDKPITWQSKRSKDMTPEERRKLKAQIEAARAAREEETARRQAAAIQVARRMWEAAQPAKTHAYLERKQVRAFGLRIGSYVARAKNSAGVFVDVAIPDVLFVPLRAEGKPDVMGMQVIFQDKNKPLDRDKTFPSGTPKIGKYHCIGKPLPGMPFAICEGYATGASIHMATGFPVVVAFDSGNLAPVAKDFRKRYPDAPLLLCADNDQWTTRQDGTPWNPGLEKAQSLGASIGIPVAVPQFANTDTKPTDFNDLHVLEGLPRVKELIHQALAPPAAPEPESCPLPEEYGGPPMDMDDAGPDCLNFNSASLPFRCLGFAHGVYYYLPNGTRQVVGLRAKGHDSTALLALAPLEWWENTFPARKEGTSWAQAASVMMRWSEAMGIYDPSKLRGRGAWIDQGRAVIHLGDRLIVDGEPQPMGRFKSRYIYEQGPASENADIGAAILPPTEAVKLAQLCDMLSWEKPIYGKLLAGWCVIAPICGALAWRPHIWVTGPSGSGKAQPHSAKVLTPNGWRSMGELRQGDYVTTPDNAFGRVMRVYPQGVVPIYRLRFADGRETRATADHLWKVRIEGAWRLRTTSELFGMLERGRPVVMPLPGAVTITANTKEILPVHPYVLGAMLGDGYMGRDTNKANGARTLKFTTKDCEILMHMEEKEPDIVKMAGSGSDLEWSFKHLSHYGKNLRQCIKELRLLGTRSHDKFIPSVYLEATIEDRLELLRGLMDTDGTVDEKGSLSFCTVSPQLAKDVAYLVRSLGGTARTHTKQPYYRKDGKKIPGKLAYIISIRLRDRSSAFCLKRKRERCEGPYQYEDSFFIRLESITPDGNEEASCIAIDHPERLYVTDDFIVTHNTWIYDNILRGMLAQNALPCQANTTEAGLRQTLKCDALPVIFDEAEGESKDDQKRIQNVLELMRQASSENGAAIIKGTPGGDAQRFVIRSVFAFCSIGVNLTQKADISRVAVLTLKRNEGPDAGEEFRKIREFSGFLTRDFAASCRERAVQLIHVIRANSETFAQAAAELLGSRRYGDQYGALLAGAYALYSGGQITLDAAREWVNSQEWEEVIASNNDDDDLRCLDEILQSLIRVESLKGPLMRSVGELAALAYFRGHDEAVPAELAAEALKRHGIRRDAQGDALIISDSARGIREMLRETPWSKNWGRMLARLRGAEKKSAYRFHGGPTRATAVPISIIWREDA